MRLVAVRPEALYRGFRIEGTKEGNCTILRVLPTRPNLPSLNYWRFRSLPHCTWPNAVKVVCDYIDQAFGVCPRKTSPQESRGFQIQYGKLCPRARSVRPIL